MKQPKKQQYEKHDNNKVVEYIKENVGKKTWVQMADELCMSSKRVAHIASEHGIKNRLTNNHRDKSEPMVIYALREEDRAHLARLKARKAELERKIDECDVDTYQATAREYQIVCDQISAFYFRYGNFASRQMKIDAQKCVYEVHTQQ